MISRGTGNNAAKKKKNCAMAGLNTPFLSIITPTFNSEKVICDCIEAVASQDYPKEKYELIIIDAGSKDKTLEIVNSYKDRLNISVHDNPLKTGEAGKSVGIDKAKGGILAFIDSDNIMPDRDFISKMLEPFEKDSGIIGTEPLYFTFREKDTPLTKYFAMSGMNDPLCLYIGNYDRYSYITGKWTGFKLDFKEDEKAITIKLDEKKIPTIGANGTFLRRDMLVKTKYSPYMFDIDIVYELVKLGFDRFVKVKIGIVHIYSRDMKSFIKKQQRRILDFLYFNKSRERTYPWSKFPLSGIIIFSICCVTILPLLFQAAAGFVRKRHIAWVYHPVVCIATLFIYGISFIKAKLFRNTGIKSRDNW